MNPCPVFAVIVRHRAVSNGGRATTEGHNAAAALTRGISRDDAAGYDQRASIINTATDVTTGVVREPAAGNRQVAAVLNATADIGVVVYQVAVVDSQRAVTYDSSTLTVIETTGTPVLDGKSRDGGSDAGVHDEDLTGVVTTHRQGARTRPVDGEVRGDLDVPARERDEAATKRRGECDRVTSTCGGNCRTKRSCVPESAQFVTVCVAAAAICAGMARARTTPPSSRDPAIAARRLLRR